MLFYKDLTRIFSGIILMNCFETSNIPNACLNVKVYGEKVSEFCHLKPN